MALLPPGTAAPPPPSSVSSSLEPRPPSSSFFLTRSNGPSWMCPRAAAVAPLSASRSPPPPRGPSTLAPAMGLRPDLRAGRRNDGAMGGHSDRGKERGSGQGRGRLPGRRRRHRWTTIATTMISSLQRRPPSARRYPHAAPAFRSSSPPDLLQVRSSREPSLPMRCWRTTRRTRQHERPWCRAWRRILCRLRDLLHGLSLPV